MGALSGDREPPVGDGVEIPEFHGVGRTGGGLTAGEAPEEFTKADLWAAIVLLLFLNEGCVRALNSFNDSQPDDPGSRLLVTSTSTDAENSERLDRACARAWCVCVIEGGRGRGGIEHD